MFDTQRLLLFVMVLYCAPPYHATTAPKPGNEFPRKYLEYRIAHPELFEYRGGLRGQVERAKAERQRLLAGRSFKLDLDAGIVTTDAGTHDLQRLAVTGTVAVPVIPIYFGNTNTSLPPTDSRIDQILFTGPNLPDGTATDYYSEVSYGLLNLTGTVAPYSTVPSNDTVYEGTNNGLPGGGNAGALMKDALDIQDPTFDFSLFDNDGPDGVPNSGDDDGVVDLISFLHPEGGGECGGANAANIWAHRWSYRFWFGGSPYVTNDARFGGGFISIDDYNIQAALTCSGAEMDIGTFCHETGHIFGIPDLYDTDGNSQGIGEWGLMGSGNWNTQSSPAHMNAWSKFELGWIIPTAVPDIPANPVNIPQVETSPTALQLTVGNGEYFLVANRQAVGFDQHLSTCGLAIWHVADGVIDAGTQNNSVNAQQNCGSFVQQAGRTYGLALEQADGLCQLEANVSRGDSGDLFPGNSSNTSFSDFTNPNSEANNGNRTQVGVTNISACSATMNADIDAIPVPQTSAPLDAVFLIDNTGSYNDDWPNIKAQMPAIVAKLQASSPNIRFGLALFRDFPFSPFGSPGDFSYQLVLPLTANASPATTPGTFLHAIDNLITPGGGNDGPESQYEALHQLLFGLGRDLHGDTVAGNEPGETSPSSMNWLPARHRAIYLMTDADFHDSDTENYPTGTGTIPIPTLEAEGRNAVRSQVATFGTTLTLFVMVADNPGAFITQGEDGSIPNLPQTTLDTQASELTDLTGGGVFSVGTDSAAFEEAMDATINVLVNKDLDTTPESIPTLSEWAMIVFTLLLIIAGTALLVRQRRGKPA